MASLFANVTMGPPIEVFALNKAYQDDPHENKVNLTVGAYRTEEGKPWVLPVVSETEKKMALDPTLNKEYLPVLGLDSFSQAATSMLLGSDSPAILENRAMGVQTLSGTGALRVGAEFLVKTLSYSVFYYSKPTWENHRLVFLNSGFKEAREYRYWDPVTRSIDFDGMMEDLKQAPKNAVIILHACAHNPTGSDPTDEQWKKIADVCEERNLFTFFDIAYQGFASGDLAHDSKAVRYFVTRGFEMLVAQSFAKNFGLYNERVGNITFVANDKSMLPQIRSQVTLIIRGMYSNPPSHGARIVATVLNDKQLFEQWQQCIKIMSARIIQMRKGLSAELKRLGTPGSWDHITQQIGMFSFTGLSPLQVENMMKKHHVYMLKNGRINMCGLNSKNLEYVAKAIHDCVTTTSHL